ncbi:UNKNOWN [Stylonychia lemnae]|uniref:Uncharacterized protein n=1 Tax=Stylonychia lemnae TaxID=5949 RepID=A0A078B8B2_STYLE|nr:UNKNOWN [Stylonychia lemnae]|eukprot:CDW90644.1 UNKNOWN [Stylonychia lemnae]
MSSAGMKIFYQHGDLLESLVSQSKTISKLLRSTEKILIPTSFESCQTKDHNNILEVQEDGGLKPHKIYRYSTFKWSNKQKKTSIKDNQQENTGHSVQEAQVQDIKGVMSGKFQKLTKKEDDQNESQDIKEQILNLDQIQSF